jgi:hypothetical protein
MIEALSAPQRRFLAVGLFVSVLLILWAAAVDPLISVIRSSGDDRRADLRALSRDHALLANDREVQKALTTATQSPRWSRLYDSQKPEKAVLQLETDVRSLINTPNNPTSMIALTPTNRGPLTRIAAKVTFSLPVDQFAAFLGRVQAHSKLLQIENVTVQAPDFQNANTNPPLAIQADVVGYVLTRESPPK